jgi:cytidylate kinase
MPSSTPAAPVEPAGVPLHGYRGDAPEAAPLARPRGLTVAISRQAGARGTSIARKVADILAWQVFDHDTLDYLTQNDTARAQLLADVPADARQWADAQLAHLQRDRGLFAEGDTLRLIRIVLAVAARGNAVIVGRAAGFMLPAETTIHVRVVASLESRVAYLAEWLRLTQPEAAEEVRARDEQRAHFLRRTLALDPADLTGYDAVVNSDRLRVEGSAQFIGWAVRTKQMFSEPAGPPPRPGLDKLDDLAG